MVNNSLTLVGFAVSDYEVCNLENPYSPLKFTMEIEIFGQRLNDVRTIVVYIPYIYKKRIESINNEESIFGKRVIVEGLIMPKKNIITGEIYYEPTAKDIYVIGSKKKNSTDLFDLEEETNERNEREGD